MVVGRSESSDLASEPLGCAVLLVLSLPDQLSSPLKSSFNHLANYDVAQYTPLSLPSCIISARPVASALSSCPPAMSCLV